MKVIMRLLLLLATVLAGVNGLGAFIGASNGGSTSNGSNIFDQILKGASCLTTSQLMSALPLIANAQQLGLEKVIAKAGQNLGIGASDITNLINQGMSFNIPGVCQILERTGVDYDAVIGALTTASNALKNAANDAPQGLFDALDLDALVGQLEELTGPEDLGSALELGQRVVEFLTNPELNKDDLFEEMGELADNLQDIIPDDMNVNQILAKVQSLAPEIESFPIDVKGLMGQVGDFVKKSKAKKISQLIDNAVRDMDFGGIYDKIQKFDRRADPNEILQSIIGSVPRGARDAIQNVIEDNRKTRCADIGSKVRCRRANFSFRSIDVPCKWKKLKGQKTASCIVDGIKGQCDNPFITAKECKSNKNFSCRWKKKACSFLE